MIYLLLIIPHILALGGLLAFACHADEAIPREGGYGGADGGDGGHQPPRAPQPEPSRGGLPLSYSTPPRRRLHAGEQLSELHPRPLRREHEPQHPQRAPARNTVAAGPG
jgi:hypothetical protein